MQLFTGQSLAMARQVAWGNAPTCIPTMPPPRRRSQDSSVTGPDRGRAWTFSAAGLPSTSSSHRGSSSSGVSRRRPRKSITAATSASAARSSRENAIAPRRFLTSPTYFGGSASRECATVEGSNRQHKSRLKKLVARGNGIHLFSSNLSHRYTENIGRDLHYGNCVCHVRVGASVYLSHTYSSPESVCSGITTTKLSSKFGKSLDVCHSIPCIADDVVKQLISLPNIRFQHLSESRGVSAGLLCRLESSCNLYEYSEDVSSMLRLRSEYRIGSSSESGSSSSQNSKQLVHATVSQHGTDFLSIDTDGTAMLWDIESSSEISRHDAGVSRLCEYTGHPRCAWFVDKESHSVVKLLDLRADKNVTSLSQPKIVAATQSASLLGREALNDPISALSPCPGASAGSHSAFQFAVATSSIVSLFDVRRTKSALQTWRHALGKPINSLQWVTLGNGQFCSKPHRIIVATSYDSCSTLCFYPGQSIGFDSTCTPLLTSYDSSSTSRYPLCLDLWRNSRFKPGKFPSAPRTVVGDTVFQTEHASPESQTRKRGQNFSFVCLMNDGELIVRPLTLFSGQNQSSLPETLHPKAACGDTFSALDDDSPWASLAKDQNNAMRIGSERSGNAEGTETFFDAGKGVCSDASDGNDANDDAILSRLIDVLQEEPMTPAELVRAKGLGLASHEKLWDLVGQPSNSRSSSRSSRESSAARGNVSEPRQSAPRVTVAEIASNMFRPRKSRRTQFRSLVQFLEDQDHDRFQNIDPIFKGKFPKDSTEYIESAKDGLQRLSVSDWDPLLASAKAESDYVDEAIPSPQGEDLWGTSSGSSQGQQAPSAEEGDGVSGFLSKGKLDKLKQAW